MPWLIDLLYLVAVAITAPIWLWRMIRTGKIRTDWPARFGLVPRHVRATLTHSDSPPTPGHRRKRILLHAVSVGEVNAIRLLVDELAGQPVSPLVTIATTTDTGFARAMALWGQRHAVVRYPFDLSISVSRFLTSLRPDVVALVELEVWPNFTAACAKRGIALCVINGRLTERSFRRYLPIAPLIRPSFRRLTIAAVQNEAYAERFRALGVAFDSVRVTGTMKWDTAEIADSVDGADSLAAEMGIDRTRPLVVAGSTAPGEHELLMSAVPVGVQLLCAPRKPEWFEDAARGLQGCARRSRGDRGSATGRFLLDTLGELRKAYALADVVVVGRSFGQLHGSDMMEPVALGKATIVGPAVADFQDTVDALLRAPGGGGLVQATAEELPAAISSLLNNAPRRQQIAERGRAVIRQQQGATQANVQLIMSLIHQT
jgi:3-deoxy-D-manno-octulosonic-acid transferase